MNGTCNYDEYCLQHKKRKLRDKAHKSTKQPDHRKHEKLIFTEKIKTFSISHTMKKDPVGTRIQDFREQVAYFTSKSNGNEPKSCLASLIKQIRKARKNNKQEFQEKMKKLLTK